MASPNNSSKTHSTFEITLPKGVNVSTLALYGLGNAMGWNIKERVALPSDLMPGDIPEYMQITTDDLVSVSGELWGVEVYGKNAAGFLAEEKRRLKVRHYIYTNLKRDDGVIVADSDLSYTYRSRDEESFGGGTLGTYSHRLRSRVDTGEKEKLEALLAELWPLTPFPFETPSLELRKEPRWGEKDGTTQWWDLEAGAISRLRLAHYARITGIAQHVLHGAIGRSLDVINVAAGLKSKQEAVTQPAEADLEFVDYGEFRKMLKDSGLTRHAQDEIRHPIERSLIECIRTGGGARSWLPEVIVDGQIDWVTMGGNRVPRPERIARVSLAHLLDKDPKTRNVAPKKFLSQFQT